MRGFRPREGRVLDDAEELASVLHRELPDVEMVSVVKGTCVVASATDAVPASLVGRSDATEVVADQVLAARLGVGLGTELDIVSPRRRLTPMGPLPIRIRVTVDRVQAPGPGTEGGVLQVPLETAQRALWGRPEVEAIELSAATDQWALGRRVRAVLEDKTDLRIEGIEELHRPLLLALALERIMIFVAVGLILVVASLNLLCNVAMVAAEKRRDLAVLAGMGLEPVRLRRLFLLLGLGIGAVGAVGGAVIGSAIAWILDISGALPLPRGVFVVSSVPFRVDPLTVATVVGLALGLAALASWLPSRAVARREPADGLRYE